MNVMISHPMRCKTNEQIRQERAELVQKLENKGYEVVDTVFENAAYSCLGVVAAYISLKLLGKLCRNV